MFFEFSLRLTIGMLYALRIYCARCKWRKLLPMLPRVRRHRANINMNGYYGRQTTEYTTRMAYFLCVRRRINTGGASEKPPKQGVVIVLQARGMRVRAGGLWSLCYSWRCRYKRVSTIAAIAALSSEFLARVVATDPPFSVVLTDWLSMIATAGRRLFTHVRSAPVHAADRGSSATSHRDGTCDNNDATVAHGPNSRGSIRHWQPVRFRYNRPLTIRRIGTLRGRPPLAVPDLDRGK